MLKTLSSMRAEHAPSHAHTFLVRALTIEDTTAAAKVIRAAFAAQSRTTRPPSSALRETPQSIAAKIAAGGGFGAFAYGQLVAVALWRIEGGALMIRRVCVMPEERGQGPSRRLFALCESAARARRIGRLRLRVRLMLPENERFFQRMGFVRVLIEAHPGFDAPTVAVMDKRLA